MPPPTSPRASSAHHPPVPRRRLATATVCSVGIMMVLYTATFHETGFSGKDGAAMRISNSDNLLSQAELDKLEKSALHAGNCPYHPPRDSLNGMPPVWVAGYPGSGFDFVAQLIAAVTGVTSVDVYRHHGCTNAVKDGAAPTGACLTHWPLVEKDSPTSIAASTKTYYNPQAILVLRNPAYAIPSYHTRWWGAQQNKMGNHNQPNITKWQKWRNKRLEYHLTVWEQSLTEWVRGVPAARIDGVGLFVTYEDLISTQHGPNVTQQLAHFFVNRIQKGEAAVASKRNSPVPHHIRYTKCLWRRIYDEEHHTPKAYTAPYTTKQKTMFLDMLDKLIGSYSSSHDVLPRVLQGYRDEIDSSLILDSDS